jgi:ABC-2 type transport system permease protein
MNTTYTKYEILRLVRNKRTFIFSLIFPLALFLVIAGGSKNDFNDAGGVHIKFTTFYMVSMASYGAMIAAVSGGARVALERSVGWTRQLRLTPLSVRTYFRTKVLTAYAMAIVSIGLLYIAGISYGVRISPISRWLGMTGLLLIGVLPFVALGIAIGHLLTIDAMGPAVGGGSAFFGFLGGQWFPLPDHGVLHYIGEAIPSYWLTQASHVGIGAPSWPALGWIVVGLWIVGTGLFAAWAYRRDTQRV